MSKAFTKEDDGVPDAPMKKRGVPVPEPNFVTAAGIPFIRSELEHTTDPDRTRELTAHLATAQVSVPADRERAGIGATVVVENEAGVRTTYQIVGAIEADPKRGKITWQSPLAEALYNLRAGESATLPNGTDVDIISVEY
ncbi:MAG: GreA/GreB family elongation factor [Kofleriaceae bacterium]